MTAFHSTRRKVDALNRSPFFLVFPLQSINPTTSLVLTFVFHQPHSFIPLYLFGATPDRIVLVRRINLSHRVLPMYTRHSIM